MRNPSVSAIEIAKDSGKDFKEHHQFKRYFSQSFGAVLPKLRMCNVAHPLRFSVTTRRKGGQGNKLVQREIESFIIVQPLRVLCAALSVHTVYVRERNQKESERLPLMKLHAKHIGGCTITVMPRRMKLIRSMSRFILRNNSSCGFP
ncbi:UNVERIFIED_CONTAM: hypothetical protein K2H54_066492 [Gekko kuhli]